MPGRLYVGTSGFAYPGWAPRFYPPGLRAAELLAPLRGAAARGRAEQHVLRVAVRGQGRGLGRRDAAPTSGSRSRPSAAARSARSQVDPADGVPWLTGPYRAFGERLGTVLFRVPDSVRRDDAKLGGAARGVAGATCP